MRRTSKQHTTLQRPSTGINGGNTQVEVQELWIAEQLCLGRPVRIIIKEAKARFNLSHARAKDRYEAVRQQWVNEDQDQVKKWKSQAIRRLETNMDKARHDLKAHPNQLHTLLLRYEDQLAKLQGTYSAIKVDVDVTVSQNLVAVIANLAPEQVAHHLTEYSRITEAASRYRQLTEHTSDNAAE